MIVLDASAILELLLLTPGGQHVRERIASPEETLHAPHVLDLEVVQVLRRYVSSGVLDSEPRWPWMTSGRSISSAIRMSPCWLASGS